MKNIVKIENRLIGSEFPPYIIAEISANHNGSMQTALQIIDEAKKAGADAVKLQTYTPDTITLNCNDPDFCIRGGLWDGYTLYELYQKAHMPWDWHKPIFEYANKIGMTIFSSPFDTTAVDLLEDLGAPAYKIASFEAIDLPLIRYAASTGKPLIISTGMADLQEIEEAVETAHAAGCCQLAILHCVSGYPAPPQDYNLQTIPDMITKFDLVTGLSDHTLDNTTAIASVALGASIIEKHFTLDRTAGGPDDSFSLEPTEFANLCQNAKTAWLARGCVDYGQKSSEQGNIQFRRSLYFTKDLNAGDTISQHNIRSVRPGFGLPPKYYEKILGTKVNTSVKANSPVTSSVIESDLYSSG